MGRIETYVLHRNEREKNELKGLMSIDRRNERKT